MKPIRLPMPPSANRYWRNWRGRTVVSTEARAYKATVAKLLIAEKVKPLPGDVQLIIQVLRGERRGDLDNRVKVISDALRGYAFEDDSQVRRLTAARTECPGNGCIIVAVTPDNDLEWQLAMSGVIVMLDEEQARAKPKRRRKA